MSCFFAIVFGLMQIGICAPNIKAVTEGRVAGKLTYDIIERKPQIKIDDPQAKSLPNLKGQIEFKNVSFSYPSNPQLKVLSNFSARFEQGKTTAIVGASGSGKSTII